MRAGVVPSLRVHNRWWLLAKYLVGHHPVAGYLPSAFDVHVMAAHHIHIRRCPPGGYSRLPLHLSDGLPHHPTRKIPCFRTMAMSFPVRLDRGTWHSADRCQDLTVQVLGGRHRSRPVLYRGGYSKAPMGEVHLPSYTQVQVPRLENGGYWTV